MCAFPFLSPILFLTLTHTPMFSLFSVIAKNVWFLLDMCYCFHHRVHESLKKPVGSFLWTASANSSVRYINTPLWCCAVLCSLRGILSCIERTLRNVCLHFPRRPIIREHNKRIPKQEITNPKEKKTTKSSNGNNKNSQKIYVNAFGNRFLSYCFVCCCCCRRRRAFIEMRNIECKAIWTNWNRNACEYKL